MSTKATVHNHKHLTLSEIESLIKHIFDALIFALTIGFTLWLVVGMQIEPSSGGAHSMDTINKSIG